MKGFVPAFCPTFWGCFVKLDSFLIDSSSPPSGVIPYSSCWNSSSLPCVYRASLSYFSLSLLTSPTGSSSYLD